MPGETWSDLLDPTLDELRPHLPSGVPSHVLDRLLRGAPRPNLESHGDYVLGAFLVAVAVPEENDVFYQEVDLLLTRERLLTVRRTPPGRRPYDPEPVLETGRDGDGSALLLARLADDVAERYLDYVDGLSAEIDELEDGLDEWRAPEVRERLLTLRHQMLHVRRMLGPMREAVRSVADGRVELAGEEVFGRDLEGRFAAVHDTLLRAAEGIDLARDLLMTVADYHQAKIASEQNEVGKRLTVIATMLLLPTLLVGIYGQNFEHVPELGWGFGYYYSLGVIVLLMLGALALFKWRKYF